MARIELVDLAHRYTAHGPYALKPQRMVWEDASAYALLGPSGSGKTTLLNLISGLLSPSGGRVLFDGRDVTDLPPEQRNIAQVFQFPVVYEAMTVFDNLAFPLRNRHRPAPAITARVAEIADILELTPDLRRRAGGLSAEAKQRISLGRGLVRQDVAAVLLDEPLTEIDPHVRWLLRRQLKRIHQQLNVSLIYVTHDQVEALTFADRVVVMHEGEVVQVGSPQALFEMPEHTFVGHFIGSPGMNLLPCEPAAEGVSVAGQCWPLPAPQRAQLAAAGTGLTLGVRPEFVCCADAGPALSATVLALDDLGTGKLLTAAIGPHRVLAKLPAEATIDDTVVRLSFRPEQVHFYVDQRRLA